MNAPGGIAQAGRHRAREQLPAPLMPSLAGRRLQCYLALLVADGLALFAGMASAGLLHADLLSADLNAGLQADLHRIEGNLGQSLLLAHVTLPLFLTIALYNGSYSIRSLERPALGAARAVVALLVAGMVFLFIAVTVRGAEPAWWTLLPPGLGSAGLLVVALRMAMRRLVRWRCGRRIVNVLAIDDDGPPLAGLGTCLVRAADLGLAPALDDPHALHRIGLALRHADQVVVSCPPERRRAWAMVLKGANVSGEVIDDRVVELGALGARLDGGHGLLAVSVGPLGLRSRAAKRGFDLVVAGLALLAALPLLMLTALAIVVEDGGPVVFAQLRLGRGNRFFRIYKFRSMRHDRADGGGTISTSRTDHRVTRVGRFIRRTSLDELPQLINVLRGEMSLVGPRPHAIASQAGAKLFWEVDQRYWLRHALKPGITGLAQVRGWRGTTETETDLARRLAADLEYLHGWSLWRDIGILVATLRVIVHDRAY